MTSETDIKAHAKSTKRNPEHSKKVLISATLDTIAETGIGDATVSKIISRAGLSRGMIHLHFGGKSQLFTAAAKEFSKVYYQELEASLQAAGSHPVAIILSVIKADLSENVMNVRSTRIWHAFRGAAGTDSGIARFSNTRDKRLREILQSAFMEIANDDDSKTAPQQAKIATYGLLVMLEGMWVDYLANANSFSRREATAIVSRFIAGLFPNHAWHVG